MVVPKPAKSDEIAKQQQRIERLRDAMRLAGYETGKKSAADDRMPQAELATAAKIENATITRLLNGQRSGTYETYKKLAPPLHVRAEWIWDGSLPRGERAGVLGDDPPMRKFMDWYLDQPLLHMACTKGNHALSAVLRAYTNPPREGEHWTVEQWDAYLAQLQATDVAEIPHRTASKEVLQHVKRTRGR